MAWAPFLICGGVLELTRRRGVFLRDSQVAHEPISQEKNTKVQGFVQLNRLSQWLDERFRANSAVMSDQLATLHHLSACHNPPVLPNCVRYELGTFVQQAAFPLDDSRRGICTWKYLESTDDSTQKRRAAEYPRAYLRTNPTRGQKD